MEYRSTGTVGKSTVVRSTVGGWSGGERYSEYSGEMYSGWVERWVSGMKCITLGELCSGEKYSG